MIRGDDLFEGGGDPVMGRVSTSVNERVPGIADRLTIAGWLPRRLHVLRRSSDCRSEIQTGVGVWKMLREAWL